MSHKRTAIAMASMTLLASFALASEQNSASTTELHQIKPVTVFASRFEEQATDSLPQTSYITSQEIVKSGASNVSEVLAKVAGLPTRANLDGSTNAVIDMRGYGEAADNNVVVLLDGVRISEYEQSAARTSMIPLEAIDHIEITKTGNSVLYGDGANGGTINIVTKKNLDELTVASAGVASYSGYQSSIYHANKDGNNNFNLFARQYASNHYRQNAEGNEKSLGMNWIHHATSETQLGMRFFVSKEINELPGALPLIYLNSGTRQAQVPGYRWDSLVDTNSITLFGTTKIDRVELSLDINQRIKQTSDDYSYNASSVFSGYAQPGWNQSYGTSASHANSLAINPRAKISDFLTSKNTLIVGFDYAKNTKTGDGRKTSASTANQIDFSNYAFHYQTSAYYLRDTLDLTSSDRITLGYRKQYYSQDKNLYLSDSSNPTPTNYPWQGKDSASANEIQYSKTISATLLGFVRYSENFRIPNIDDNSSSAYYDPVTYATIPLVPQKSKDVDIGANLKTDQYSAEILYFKSNIKNEIGYDPNLGNLNYDPTKREGFNLRQRLGLAKNLATRLMLQYTNAKFTEGANMGKNTPNVPPVFGNLSFDYSVTQKGQITATTRFSSSRFMSGDFDNSHAKTPGYTVQDLSYFHKEKNWSLAATLSNVTNKKYADTGIYKATFTAPYQSTVYPNFGRNFSLVGRYTF